ncbi:MAG: polysaccharide deacetylase family protein, partial [Clostridium sp.]
KNSYSKENNYISKKPEENIADSVEINVKLVPYKGVVEHIFFHPLISDVKVAFQSGDRRTNNFDDWFITPKEFNKILDSLYAKGFILVDINDIYEEYEKDGIKRMRRKELLIPYGKKPLIISIDDLSYNTGNKGGINDRLIIGKDGNLAALSYKDNKEIVSYNNEIIPILDRFIKTHPDFSNNNAKATLALTGYEGILGYRTQKNSQNRKEEIESVKPIIKKLKENGWTFASHSYGHNNIQKQSLEKLKIDADKWEKEVKSLVGDTMIFIYPHGWEMKTDDPKLKYLQEKGFRIFYSVGPHSYEMISSKTNAVLSDRMAVDGVTLRNRGDEFLKFYDANEIIDLEARPKR